MLYKKLKKLYYTLVNKYATTNNIVLAIALVIGASWAWSSIGVMQRNYSLQAQLTKKERQVERAKLQVRLLEYQKDYHQSAEFQELAARRDLGLVDPGENVVILPEYKAAGAEEAKTDQAVVAQAETSEQPGNFEQWRNFLLGHNQERLQRNK